MLRSWYQLVDRAGPNTGPALVFCRKQLLSAPVPVAAGDAAPVGDTARLKSRTQAGGSRSSTGHAVIREGLLNEYIVVDADHVLVVLPLTYRARVVPPAAAGVKVSIATGGRLGCEWVRAVARDVGRDDRRCVDNAVVVVDHLVHVVDQQRHLGGRGRVHVLARIVERKKARQSIVRARRRRRRHDAARARREQARLHERDEGEGAIRVA
eukprot:COSAG02_NODE_4940_length_4809_cov_26.880042_6_plen_210_part_00